jgi:hypothetical protein
LLLTGAAVREADYADICHSGSHDQVGLKRGWRSLVRPTPDRRGTTAVLKLKGADRRDVHGAFLNTPSSASRNYSVNIPSVNAFSRSGIPSLVFGRLFYPLELALGFCFMVVTLVVVDHELSDCNESMSASVRLPHEPTGKPVIRQHAFDPVAQ